MGMKTIIVATDFSPVAHNAALYAADMAKEINASLLLFHAYQIPVALAEVPVASISVEEMHQASSEQLQNLRASLQHVYGESLPISIEAVLGDTVEELKAKTEELKPFAVIMGSKDNLGMEKIFLGSTTLHAIKHLSYPVIAIPRGVSYKHISKMGLACDFRDVVNVTPVNVIKEIVGTFNAELHVLNIRDEEQDFDEAALESAYLETILESVKPKYHFLPESGFAEGIDQFAIKNQLDLVIVLPKKHPFWESLFHKSRSAALVKESHVPIMSIHES